MRSAEQSPTWTLQLNKELAQTPVEVIEELKQRLPLSDNEKNHFVGRVFQDMVYHYLTQGLENYETLLSPEETLEFFHELYPKKVIEPNFFGLDSLTALNTPDGLLIDHRCVGPNWEETVVAIYEYTLQTTPSLERRLEKKKESLRRVIKKNYSYFDMAELRVVTPQSTVWIENPDESPPYAFHQAIPLTHAGFRNYLDLLTLKHLRKYLNEITVPEPS